MNTKSQPHKSDLISLVEASKCLKVSHSTVLRWVLLGKMRGVNVASPAARPRWKVSKSEVEELLEKKLAAYKQFSC